MVKTKEVVKLKTREIDPWQNPDWVRKIVCPKLTQNEWEFFKARAQQIGADPLSSEIVPIHFKGKMVVFAGRDYHLRMGQEQKEYLGYRADAVYRKDDFEVKDGVPSHRWDPTGGDRGELLGAYCVIKRKGVDIDTFIWCSFSEYNKASSVPGKANTWNLLTSTMLIKCAVSQCFRAAFAGVYHGMPSVDEAPFYTNPPGTIDAIAEQAEPPPPEVPTELENEIDIFMEKLYDFLDIGPGEDTYPKAKVFYDSTFTGHPDYTIGNITFIDSKEKLDSALAALRVAEIEAAELEVDEVDEVEEVENGRQGK